MTPAQIVQVDKERLASENTQVAANSAKQSVIKLKNHVMLANKSDLAEIKDVCYALICKDALFSMDDISSTLPSLSLTVGGITPCTHDKEHGLHCQGTSSP